jgi:CHAT domain-containing protein
VRTPTNPTFGHTARGNAARQHKDWTLLFYLCGDNDAASGELVRATTADLREIARAGHSPFLHVAVQRDGPEGCERFTVSNRGTLVSEASLGRVNSGSADTLTAFLRWGFERCPSTYVGLVFAGTGILDPRSAVGVQQRDPDRVFSICDDGAARDALEISELGRVLDDACQSRPDGYRQIDLLAFDMGQMQFLEVACELQGRVGVLVGPQSEAPATGWNNTQMLRGWHRWLARQHAPRARRVADPVAALARVTVDLAGASYVSALPRQQRVEVCALDLRRLERLLGPFDAMAVAYLQHLSDRLAWQARGDAMRRPGVKQFLHEYSYDMRAIMAAVSAELARAANRGAIQRSLDLLATLDSLKLVKALETIEQTTSELVVKTRDTGLREVDPATLSDDDPELAELEVVHHWLQAALQRAWDIVRAPHREAVRHPRQAARAVLAGFPFARDATTRVTTWMTLLARSLPILPIEIAGVLGTAIREKQHADRLHRLTAQVVSALDPAPTSAAGGARPSASDGSEASDGSGGSGGSGGSDGRVILHLFRSASAHGGLSLYRPKDLSELTRRSYLALRINRRLHWTALLTAIHLLEDQPETLWGVFSSLLASAGPGGRDELIVRMAGPQSATRVEQFNALGPAPALVLSLEQENGSSGANVSTFAVDGFDAGDATSSAGGASAASAASAGAATSAEGGAGDGAPSGGAAANPVSSSPAVQSYRVRLTSSRRDAAIFEQQSRVNPKTIDAVLRGLESVLAARTLTIDQVRDAQNLGALLGEDIVRDLTDRLEDERQREGGNLHLLLQIPQSLMRYPWELIRDRHGWLSERFAMGRQVYLPMGSVRWRTRRSGDRLRVLIIGDPLLEGTPAPAPQLPGAALEAEQVAQVFERLADETSDLIDFDRARDLHIRQSTTIVNVRSWLRRGDYDIVHFAGHARFVPSRPECSAWLLSDGQLWAAEIRNTLAMCDSPPWLVYANACEAAMEADGRAVRYQQDVFGLATAFITQGVTAYLAPLWPLDDRAAMLAATDFYRTLVLDRATLGDSLRIAKREARARLPEVDTNGLETVAPTPPQERLSWASLVLYGDATATLMQRLGSILEGSGPSADSASLDRDRASDSVGSGVGAGSFDGGSPSTRATIADSIARDSIVRRGDVSLPSALPADLAHALPFPDGTIVEAPGRVDTPAPARSVVFDVVEQAGIRFWRITDDRGRARTMPRSPFRELVEAERTRLRVQRGVGDQPRVLSRWALGLGANASAEPSIRDLVRHYDVHVTPQEQMLLIADGEITPLDEEARAGLDRSLIASGGRALLLLHDTCGRSRDLVGPLTSQFLSEARRHYGAILGFDHWTLSKSPRDNATDLWMRLPRTIRQGRQRLDIVAHGRGGLVARALVESIDQPGHVGRVVLVATPNAGTSLASETTFGAAADLLINLLHIDDTGTYGRLAALFARLALTAEARRVLPDIPGLAAQHLLPSRKRSPQPTSPARARSVRYAIVAASFEPSPGDGLLRRLLSGTTNNAARAIFPQRNDLIVDATSAWQNATPTNGLGTVPVLFFDPAPPPKTKTKTGAPPAGTTIVRMSGVHHTNLLTPARAQQFLREQLWEED